MADRLTSTAAPRPLVALSDDEHLFRDSVRQFAEDALRPRVRAMDEACVFDPALIRQFHELGLMGIEVPLEFGGAGGSFFEAILAVEELSRIDASAGVIVDVQNTLVNNALLQWAKFEILDIKSGKVVFDRLLTFRGDDDTAWQRAEAFVARDLLSDDALWAAGQAESK